MTVVTHIPTPPCSDHSEGLTFVTKINTMSPRSALMLLALLFICDAAFGQYRNRYRRGGSKFDVRIGAQAGLTTPNIGGDDFIVVYDSNNLELYPEVNYTALNGYTAGIYADIRLTDRLYVQPEINFVQMGSAVQRDIDLLNIEGAFTLTDSSTTFLGGVQFFTEERRLSYLSFPVQVKVPLDRGFNLMFGPQFGFLISQSVGFGATSIPDSLIGTYGLIDPGAPSTYKSADIGGIVGLNYQFKNGLNFNIRYNQNFKNINKNEGFDILTREPRNSNRAMVFTVAYTFLYSKRLKEDISRRN